MQLGKIFYKPVERHIEGVIKADDADFLMQEVEEYVITDEVNRRLHRFFDEYKESNPTANGVWISGFFGSGKSHLLKILSMLLENRDMQGTPMVDHFIEKCPKDDPMFIADIKKSAAIPSKSILFNIDQKAYIKSKRDVDAVLSVFENVFNSMCGYYGKQGYIAQFERDLDKKHLFTRFKEEFQSISGITWEKGRERALMESHYIDQAYGKVTGLDASNNLIKHYREDYNLNIEDFAGMVRDYINEQEPGFRLNFFVDEVGQYIADNVKLMTNLQTIAESLDTACKGKSWIIVTAQEDLRDIIGDLTKQQGNDFSKIQDRFSIRLKLTSANVEEVIRKRLLIKNAHGVQLLSEMYDRFKNDFQTRFDFVDGSKRYKIYADKDEFIHTYPFVKYQFPLFQAAIQNLSLHNAFEGKHSSVGERSMLGVFQLVAKHVAEEEVGCLASFDMMYEGISPALKTQIQSSVNVAVEHLSHEPFAVKMLKALFLVKYIKEFKATVANLTVLMCSAFDENPIELKQNITHALELLENQSYIRRNDDTYEFLTDEEKDIEEEIKNTDYTNREIYETLQDLLYAETLGNLRKISYSNHTGQAYSFTQKIDEEHFSKEQELAIRIITPFHDRFDKKDQIIAESTHENALFVFLEPHDKQFVRELLLFKQTAKFIKQNQASTVQESVHRILKDKAEINSIRYQGLQRMIADMFSHAEFYVNGYTVEPVQGTPKVRVADAFQNLISQVYPNLRMLHDRTYSEDMIRTIILNHEDLLLSTESVMSEADNEVFSFIQSKNFDAHRVSVKGILDRYERSPYGWYLSAILCIIAELYALNKIEIKRDSNVLEGGELVSALKNNRLYDNLIIFPQVEFSSNQVRKLKEFYKDYFEKPSDFPEARSLGKATAESFSKLYKELHDYLEDTGTYPFLKDLEKPLQRIKQVCDKPYDYYLTTLPEKFDELLDDKEDIINPVQEFFSGTKQEDYKKAQELVKIEEANAPYIDQAGWSEIQEILADQSCYKGNRMVRLNALVDSLSQELQRAKKKEKDLAAAEIEHLKHSMQMQQEYVELDEYFQEKIISQFERFLREVSAQKFIPNIRAMVQKFKDEVYTELLQQVDRYLSEQRGSSDEVKEPAPVIEYVSVNSLTPQLDNKILGSEEDVDAYIREYRKNLIHEIKAGKKIRV